MTSSALRAGCGVLLVLLLATAFSACGEDRPADVLVDVGDDSITQADFDRWLAPWRVVTPIAKSQLVPPRFSKCVAAMGRGQGSAAAPAAERREQCATLFTTTLGSLVDRRWLELEAERLGVQLDAGAVSDDVRRRSEQAGGETEAGQPASAALARAERQRLSFIRQLAQTEVLGRQVRNELLARSGTFSEAEVERYSSRYPLRFAKPATRTVRVLAAPTDARARQALRALRNGEGAWGGLAKRLTIDENTITSPTGVTTLSEDDGDAALLDVAFKTAPGQVGGPVQAQNGRFVFLVTAARPRSSTAVAARRAARRLLEDRREAQVRRDFTTHYVRETICHRGYRALRCGNR
jgi:PPIC-type PPIASE domain